MTLNISHIENLCRSDLGVAENKTKEFIENVHIETVDSFIKSKINNKSIVFLTGNPGDGKTHLIKKIENEISDDVEIIYEAGEIDLSNLKDTINKCKNSTKPAIIAINTGILASLLDLSKDCDWYEIVRDQLFSPFLYDENNNYDENNKFFVLDLNFRNNLSKTIVTNTLNKILNIAKKPCENCPGNCAPLKNVNRLEKKEVQNQLTNLMDLVSSKGQHATFRDLNAFLSFLIFGNTSCNNQKIQRKIVDHFYFENAFKKSNRFENPGIHLILKKLDPIYLTNFEIDEKIWKDEIKNDEWIMSLDDDRNLVDLDIVKKRTWFKRKKRRYFFENINSSSSDFLPKNEDLFNDMLERKTNALSTIIQLINKSFGENNSERLSLWQTHRFDTPKDTHAIKMHNIVKEELTILEPKLHPAFINAFPDWKPDHLLLIYGKNIKKAGENILRIDRSVVESLSNLKQGQTTKFRNSETYSKIAFFLEKIAFNKIQSDQESTKEISIIDIEKKIITKTLVHIDEKKYLRSN